MKRKILLLILVSLLPVLLLSILAQQAKKSSAIEMAIDAKEFQKADSIFKVDVARFITAGNFDTLVAYVTYAGEIGNGLDGADKAVKNVMTYIDMLHSKNPGPVKLVNAWRNAAEFFGTIGQNQGAYDASRQALNNTIEQPEHTQADIARCEYNLGTYANRLGNVALSETHHRKAMQIRDADKNTDPENIYFSANAMGGLMWYGSKYDSAVLFFNKALNALKTTPSNDLNHYFRPGNIENNIAAVYSSQGKTSEAIQAMQNAIENFQKFIDSKEPSPKKKSATEGLYEAIDNLAGIYKEIGDYGKAGELLNYSYRQKLQKLDPNHAGIFISEILLGQHYHSIREDNKALDYLLSGLAKLEKTDGDYLFWAADANYNLAMIYEHRKEHDKALEAYKKAELLYETSYGGAYDNVYMDFLRNVSLFYANNGDYNSASERANKVYTYLQKVGESNSLQGFYQLLNIAEINYISGRYAAAITYCNNALNTVNTRMKDGVTLLDSVKIEVFKPKAILINARSVYALQQNKDTSFLNGLSSRLNEALAILEKRKVLIDDEASINILIADHQELIDFAKKIALQLYEASGNGLHLDRFINLHESALYNRIRSRIDKQQAVHFAKLPTNVQQEEVQLKKDIIASLQNDKKESGRISGYINAVSRWEAHLDKVKTNYPAYYNLRYASIFKPLQQLQAGIPDSSTVVRYFFVDSSLLVLVADKQHKFITRISSNGLEEKINKIFSSTTGEKEMLPVLYELYTMLWKPVAPAIKTRKVIIIPDGFLYNLSFDAMTDKPVNSYNDLAANSLLAKYSCAYNYSLFMLGQTAETGKSKENYIAFAPGFSDEIKNKYTAAIKDSVKLDYDYLRLLPQPATNKLAKKIKGLIGGDIFLDENSTQASFIKNAGGHAIIHIATHAAYNNVYPERSGLIFAKNSGASQDSNFLSLYDIYNCNMQSELTVLTACESGKPGYQDGEGMVSLAHAFNYAGSKQILTALWKIDEQSSTQLTGLFIEYIKKGFATDEALRLAKLHYLNTTDGRMLAPAYWAGLVILGEPGKLILTENTDFTPIIIGIAAFSIIIVITIFVLRRGKKRKENF